MACINSTQPSNYLDLYKYLSVLTEVQITKLRNIALGIPSTFTPAEIQDLEKNLGKQPEEEHESAIVNSQ